MRNSKSARYFAGFPIGFNVTLGGNSSDGADLTNELSFRFLKAQEHVALTQPNLTARLHKNTPDDFILECSRIIGLGTGMPQIMNDESVVPALLYSGLSHEDAINYAAVGCVELSSQGNFLGWSDAAMFNMVKVLELTLNNGVCMVTEEQLGPMIGDLTMYNSYQELEDAFRKLLDHFVERMLRACEVVERAHQLYLPSPLLSAVVNECISRGTDVTKGGAKYNFSGLQAIQVANLADSLASIKKLVYDENIVAAGELLNALRSNFSGNELLRQTCLQEVAKYGNDEEWVDFLGAKWVKVFNNLISKYKNFRGGDYQMGLYTVSAHVPMGKNVGATPDGRRSGEPLADGGTSPMSGQDKLGPTAVFGSVSRIDSLIAGNGTLLNMKFLPDFFKNSNNLEKFASLLKGFIRSPIHHVQFNVVSPEEMKMAKAEPEKYSGMIVRVAGYSAYFVELAEELQDEIIKRTSQHIF
jgi:pyruvate formate-lyase/glycerol dehydratase family glycyl radical enzyme